MRRTRAIRTALLWLGCALAPSVALAQNISTINPAAPAANSPLLSAVVRGNFASAYNDINKLYSLAGSTLSGSSCPSALVPYQFFTNNASAPTGTLLQIYDGAQCVTWATLNQTAHTVGATFGGLSTFSGGIEISGAGPSSQLNYPFFITNSASCSTGCGALLVSGSLSGTTAAQIFWNDLAVANDNAALTSAGSNMGLLYVLDTLNGAQARGGRIVLWGDFSQTVVSANAANTVQANYVGAFGRAQTTSGDGGSGSTYWGNYFGGNFYCGNNGTGLNLVTCTGAEFDNYGLASATQKYKFGINLGDGNGSTASAGGWDTAIAAYTLGAASPYPQGRGWQMILSVGNIAGTNFQPMASTGTIIGTHLESPITQILTTNGIDWSNIHFSGYNLKCGSASGVPGTSLCTIDGAGNISTVGSLAAAAANFTGTVTFADGSTWTSAGLNSMSSVLAVSNVNNGPFGLNVTNTDTGSLATATMDATTNAGHIALTASSAAGGPFASIQSTVGGTFFIDSVGGVFSFRTGSAPTAALNISAAQVLSLPAVTTGTPAASACFDASNNIIKKTTAGSCI